MALRPALVGRRVPRRVYDYFLYGLRLRSEWPLPCPEGAREEDGPQIQIFSGPASLFSGCREARGRSEHRGWALYVPLPDGSEYLRWTRLFEFLVFADGRRIAGRPLNDASGEAFQTYLLGQVLSHSLIKHGIEPLHATVVEINGRAVAFMGDGGYGKSTLAAAFLQRGYPLLTDDLLVLTEGDRGLLAHPGLPRIKLFPEIARCLLDVEGQGTPMNPLTPKLIVPLDRRRSSRAPAPVAVIYLLRRPRAGSKGATVTIRRLSRRRTFVELLRNTYNRDVIQPARLERQFFMAARLTAEVPVKLLSYPHDLAALPSVREAVLSDLAR